MQWSGCGREAGYGKAHSLADHLNDARGEVAHSVCAPLTLMDVAFPAAVRMLLQHLWQMGERRHGHPSPDGRESALKLQCSSSPAPKEAQHPPLLPVSIPMPHMPPGLITRRPAVWRHMPAPLCTSCAASWEGTHFNFSKPQVGHLWKRKQHGTYFA